MAITAVNMAQKIFKPGARPPSELIPLVEPVIRLRKALASTDQQEARRCAADLVADRDVIQWACGADQPREIKEFGYLLAYLAMQLDG
jgi:hypothetical protein